MSQGESCTELWRVLIGKSVVGPAPQYPPCVNNYEQLSPWALPLWGWHIPLYSFLMRYHSWLRVKVARNYGGPKWGAHSVPTPHSNFAMKIIPCNFHPGLSSFGGDMYLYIDFQRGIVLGPRRKLHGIMGAPSWKVQVGPGSTVTSLCK